MMTIDEKAHLLRMLGHPVRLRILAILVDQCVCVKEVWQRLSLPQAVVSQHLKILKASGIVSARRDGTRVCYSVKMEMLTDLFTVTPSHQKMAPIPCAVDR